VTLLCVRRCSHAYALVKNKSTLLYLFLEHGHPDDAISISSGSETDDGQQEQEEFSDVEPDDDDDNDVISISSSSDEEGLQLIGVYYLHIPPCKRLSGYSTTCRHVHSEP